MKFFAATFVAFAAGALAAPPMVTRQSDDDNSMLNAHNYYRAQHGAGPLSWDQNLVNQAYNNAVQCQFAHTQNDPYGENLYAAGGDASYQSAIDSWMSEASQYSYGFSENTGHFTQVVWKSTQRLGCVRYTGCSEASLFGDGVNNPATYVVCEYDPPGNYGGEYSANVQP